MACEGGIAWEPSPDAPYTDSPLEGYAPCPRCGRRMVLVQSAYAGIAGEVWLRRWWCACGHAEAAPPCRVSSGSLFMHYTEELRWALANSTRTLAELVAAVVAQVEDEVRQPPDPHEGGAIG